MINTFFVCEIKQIYYSKLEKINIIFFNLTCYKLKMNTILFKVGIFLQIYL